MRQKSYYRVYIFLCAVSWRQRCRKYKLTVDIKRRPVFLHFMQNSRSDWVCAVWFLSRFYFPLKRPVISRPAFTRNGGPTMVLRTRSIQTDRRGAVGIIVPFVRRPRLSDRCLATPREKMSLFSANISKRAKPYCVRSAFGVGRVKTTRIPISTCVRRHPQPANLKKSIKKSKMLLPAFYR